MSQLNKKYSKYYDNSNMIHLSWPEVAFAKRGAKKIYYESEGYIMPKGYNCRLKLKFI